LFKCSYASGRPDCTMLATCPFFRPSVRSSVCHKTCQHDILKTTEPVSNASCTSGPRGKGNETIHFGSQDVKGHTRRKIDLEAWRRHHSRPLTSSSFSSFSYICHAVNIIYGFILYKSKFVEIVLNERTAMCFVQCCEECQ